MILGYMIFCGSHTLHQQPPFPLCVGDGSPLEPAEWATISSRNPVLFSMDEAIRLVDEQEEWDEENNMQDHSYTIVPIKRQK